ncbi:MAG TPA: sigma-54 dependent transcriptional regulator [Terriglobales bacterium]|nr:sigma-54 dependent transcriptional regulator [Terriglobales bacterium]
MQAKAKILIAEDDEAMAKSVGDFLSRRNFEIAFAVNHEESLRSVRSFDPSLVLLDYSLPPVDGTETLERIKQVRPDTPVIVYSGHTAPEIIFRVSKLGAEDFVSTPFQLPDLYSRIARVLEKSTNGDGAQIRDRVRGQSDFTTLFGTSPKMEEIKNTIEQVADTNATVLIRGESGTGKEVVARMVYRHSVRRDKPFVKVNCAAIPHELLESELFGYEPGAFTGANRQKLGKFEQANYGTLFLDEISEMHPALQAKLLHVLQDGQFSRLGGKRDIAVDVRVLAATNKFLEQAVGAGAFREDLFYRLNVVTIHIPPLRERREEILLFLEFFLSKYSEFYGKHPPPFSDYAMQRMMEYAWPGNIRELENLVKRYVIVGNEAQIIREISTHKPIMSSNSAAPPSVPAVTQASAAAPVPTPAAGEPEPEILDENSPSLLEIGRRAAAQAEHEAISRVLLKTRWNRRKAAKILKISYKALLNKIQEMEQQNAQYEQPQT